MENTWARILHIRFISIDKHRWPGPWPHPKLVLETRFLPGWHSVARSSPAPLEAETARSVNTTSDSRSRGAIYPLVNVYIAMENHHFSWENSL